MDEWVDEMDDTLTFSFLEYFLLSVQEPVDLLYLVPICRIDNVLYNVFTVHY